MRWSPVSLKMSHESIVPNAARPSRARSRRPGTWSSSQAILVAEKYGSSTRPVRARMSGSWPPARSCSHRGAVRRSCQTSARCRGSPVDGSHTQTVSRWLAIPTACSSPGRTPASASASPATAWVTLHSSPRSCSTQPGWGKCWRNSRYARPIGSKSESYTKHVVPVVPWSIARIISARAYRREKYTRPTSRS